MIRERVVCFMSPLLCQVRARKGVCLQLKVTICQAFGLMAILLLLLPMPSLAKNQHGITMHGTPALAENFEHLPYTNLDAPKGGKITYGIRGSFDSVNPFILRGQKVAGIRDAFYGNNVFESLLIRSRDEPFTLYGLLAEKVIMPDDRSFIEFKLNPKARFSDGMPVRAEDVIFSANLLAEKGRPNYQRYYSRIKKIEKTGKRSVRFTFTDATDRELPLLLSLLPILPEHATHAENFDKTTLKPMIGTGPYRLVEVNQGVSIKLKKNPDYWANYLPVKQGFDNFDEIEITYYRESNALFEAFKKGLVDVYFERDPNAWASNYQSRAFQDGALIKSEFATGLPASVRGYAFNTRREFLKDKEVRRALSMLFDFEWINNNLFSGGFKRTSGFFQGSELSSLGISASQKEVVILRNHINDVLPDVLKGKFKQIVTDGTGRDRTVLRQAFEIFKAAGFKMKNRKMHTSQGVPFILELLLPSGGNQERLALAYSQNLARLGIDLKVRQVDAAQFEERRKSFDFDMISWSWAGSLSPGNEQYFRWSTPFANRPGSFNFSGVQSPAIDSVLDQMLTARDRPDFVNAVRAFDRLLISGFYVLPHYHLGKQLVAHSSKIGMPKKVSLYGARPDTWWIKGANQ